MDRQIADSGTKSLFSTLSQPCNKCVSLGCQKDLYMLSVVLLA